MTEPEIVKEVEWKRSDQLITILKHKGIEYFTYLHRGIYIAVFGDIDSLVDGIEFEDTEPLKKFELEDYDESENKLAQMKSDTKDYIKKRAEVEDAGVIFVD